MKNTIKKISQNYLTEKSIGSTQPVQWMENPCEQKPFPHFQGKHKFEMTKEHCNKA